MDQIIYSYLYIIIERIFCQRKKKESTNKSPGTFFFRNFRGYGLALPIDILGNAQDIAKTRKDKKERIGEFFTWINAHLFHGLILS